MQENKDYFIRIEELQLEDEDESRAWQVIQPWIPPSAGIVARLHNWVPGVTRFDYITIADDAIYLAILVDGGELTLRSIKRFKQCDIVAIGLILEALEGEDPAEAPQIRLMLSEGKRIQLVFSRNVFFDDLRCQLQQMVTRPFFLG